MWILQWYWQWQLLNSIDTESHIIEKQRERLNKVINKWNKQNWKQDSMIELIEQELLQTGPTKIPLGKLYFKVNSTIERSNDHLYSNKLLASNLSDTLLHLNYKWMSNMES